MRPKIYGVQSSTLQKFTALALQYLTAEKENLQLKIEELNRNILGQKVSFLYFACFSIKISLVKIELEPRLKKNGDNALLMGRQMLPKS